MSTIEPAEPSTAAPIDPMDACDATNDHLNLIVTALSNSMSADNLDEDGPLIPGLPDEPMASVAMDEIVRAIVREMIGPEPQRPAVREHGQPVAADETPTPYYLFTYNPMAPGSIGLTFRASSADALLQIYNLMNDPNRGGAFPELAVTRAVPLAEGEVLAEGAEPHTETALYPWPFHVVDLTTGACWHHGAGPQTIENEHFGLPVSPDDDTAVLNPDPAPGLVVLGGRDGQPKPRALALARSLGRELGDFGAQYGADVFEAYLPTPGSWGAWCVYGWLPADMTLPAAATSMSLNASKEPIKALRAWLQRGAEFVLEVSTGRLFSCRQDPNDKGRVLLALEAVVENADPTVAFADAMQSYGLRYSRFSDLVRLVNLLNLLMEWRAVWLTGIVNGELHADAVCWAPARGVPVVAGIQQPSAELVQQLTEARRAEVLAAAARMIAAPPAGGGDSEAYR